MEDFFSIQVENCFIESLGLNDKQKEAVLYFRTPLLIIAGAGTGKTKTLMSKLALLIKAGIPPSRILAITFTNKAAEEMKKRVSRIVGDVGGLWCMTFHSFGARFLRMHYKEAGLKRDFVIYDEDDQKKLLAMVIKDLGYEKEKIKASLYASLISRAKDDLMDAESYMLNARISQDQTRIKTGQIYLEYQKKLEESNAVDFGDLIMKTVLTLRNNKNLMDYYQNYFRYILVDEYQDTNRAQYVLIKTLAQLHSNICVVGDPDQSIYTWRGADIRNILQFEQDFKDAYTIVLEKNYRSTANILDSANRLIRFNKQRKEKNLYTENERGEDVEIIECSNEIDEALKIANMIEKLKNKYPLSEIGIFYRTNAQSRSFEEVFLNKKIPHKIVGSIRFYERKEIKDALAYLRVLINPYDVVSFSRIINVPPRGIGEKTIEKVIEYSNIRGISFYEALLTCSDIPKATKGAIDEFLKLIDDIRKDIHKYPPHKILQDVLIKTNYWQMIEEEAGEGDDASFNRLANLQELVNAVKEYEDECKKQNTAASIEGYLERVSLTTDMDEIDKPNDCVVLMTLHLAKGLEFDVVFITGLEEGLLPINSADLNEDDLEEERRLMYVGMTRARKKLYFTWARTRKIFGKTYPNLMSRFVIECGVETYSRKKTDDINVIEAKVLSRPKAEIGRIVIHPVFGRGRIVEISGSGEFAKIKIRFDDGNTHTFMLKFAPIEIL